MNVLIFKTSIKEPKQVSEVKILLNYIPAIVKWNFDLEDCDHILRIVARNLSPRYVEAVLQTAGYTCQELED